MSFTTLIDAATLAANLGKGDWCIIDVRHQLADVGYGERVYREGHLPGAFFLHCDRDLSGIKSGLNGRHPLPGPEVFAAKLAACGIKKSTQVVVYDDAQGMIAGRLWWMLRWLEHTSVAVLDGGIQAWLAHGGELSDAVPIAGQGEIASNESAAMFVQMDEVLANLENRHCLVVDARSPDRFRGENETIDPVGGHIPGAQNRFFRNNLNDDGCFKSPEVLRTEWMELLGGASPEQVIHQCGSGVSACHNLLAMEHAGLPGARLYPGSWSEWCANPGCPLEK